MCNYLYSRPALSGIASSIGHAIFNLLRNLHGGFIAVAAVHITATGHMFHFLKSWPVLSTVSFFNSNHCDWDKMYLWLWSFTVPYLVQVFSQQQPADIWVFLNISHPHQDEIPEYIHVPMTLRNGAPGSQLSFTSQNCWVTSPTSVLPCAQASTPSFCFMASTQRLSSFALLLSLLIFVSYHTE